MTRYLGVGVVVGAVLLAPVMAANQTSGPAGAASGSPAAAIKANPDLVNGLAKEMSSTPEQAAGAAGALFGLAKSRLAPAQFSQSSRAVPGMNALLGAAPSGGGASSAVAQAAGAAGAGGGLSGVGGAFTKLGLSPDMVMTAVPFLTQYVSKLGGPAVGKLLAGVLK